MQTKRRAFDVELNVPGIGDVAMYLIQHKIVERILDINVTLEPQNFIFQPHQMIFKDAVAPYVKSPYEFWIHTKPKEVETLLNRLDELTSDPNFANTKKNFEPSIGEPCLAVFQGRWYRSVVEAVFQNEAEVNFIDYGNRSTVDIAKLRELPAEEFYQQLGLAPKCCIDGVLPITVADYTFYISNS